MSKQSDTVSFYLLISIFVLAPFYYQSNIGGLGLTLPFNITTWAAGIIYIVFVIFLLLKNNTINYTSLFTYCLFFPVIIIITGLFSTDNPQPMVWLFRQLYIVGGFIFIFVLFQVNLTLRQIEKILYWIVFSTLLHSLIGLIEIFNLIIFSDWMPMSKDQLPIGMFQQKNLQAIYLTTGILIGLFLVSRPSFSSTNILIKAMLIVTIGLSVYVALCTGSRAGALSLIIGSIVMVSSRYKQLLRHKIVMSLIVIASFTAILSAQDGIARAQEKALKITAGEYQSIRSTMYATTINLIKEKPLLGYGIGSFPSVWAEQSIKFAGNHPNAIISQATTNHPHNEVLLWMVEGGIFAVTGIIVIIIALFRALYRCGNSRGGAYAAMLIPISLHTQVELPFYGSTVHWFLWLFLFFIIFRHQLEAYTLKLSRVAKRFLQLVSLVAAIAALLFLNHAGKAQKEIYNYKFNGGGDLRVPLINPYFNSVAERITMQNMLYRSIVDKDLNSIPVFISWAENEIKGYPAQGMFLMLTDAYGSLGDKLNQCRVANRGLHIYTENEYLLNTLKSCEQK